MHVPERNLCEYCEGYLARAVCRMLQRRNARDRGMIHSSKAHGTRVGMLHHSFSSKQRLHTSIRKQ
eukprot:118146-Pleurochrysis_carterae.AAC.1